MFLFFLFVIAGIISIIVDLHRGQNSKIFIHFFKNLIQSKIDEIPIKTLKQKKIVAKRKTSFQKYNENKRDLSTQTLQNFQEYQSIRQLDDMKQTLDQVQNLSIEKEQNQKEICQSENEIQLSDYHESFNSTLQQNNIIDLKEQKSQIIQEIDSLRYIFRDCIDTNVQQIKEMCYSIEIRLKSKQQLDLRSDMKSKVIIRVNFPFTYSQNNRSLIFTLINYLDFYQFQEEQLQSFLKNIQQQQQSLLDTIIDLEDLLFKFDCQNYQQHLFLTSQQEEEKSGRFESSSYTLKTQTKNENDSCIKNQDEQLTSQVQCKQYNINALKELWAEKHKKPLNINLNQNMEQLNQEGNVRDEDQSENDSMVDSSNDSSSSNEIPLIACENISRFRQDFEDIKQIGSGGGGSVFKAKNKLDGNYYAVKQIVLDYSDSNLCQRTKNEAILLSRLQHQHIVRYYQAWTEDAPIRKKTDQISEDNEIMESESDQQIKSESKQQSEQEQFQSESEQKPEWIQQEQNYVNNKQSESDESSDQIYHQKESNSQQYYDQFHHGTQMMNEDDLDIQWQDNNYHEKEKESDIFRKQSIEIQKPKKQYLYIQMEYCQGETLKNKIGQKNMSSEMKRNIIRQILEALSYLHDKRYLHRDLKPQNIFLSDDMSVKLGDFGLATEMRAEIKKIENQFAIEQVLSQSDMKSSLTVGIGTYMYLAPEQETSSQYDQKVDMFSLGIIIFEMYYTFQTEMERFNILKALKQDGIFPEDFNKAIGIDNLDIQQKIKCLINRDPKQRPDSAEFLKEYQDKQTEEIIRTIANPKNSQFLKELFQARQSNQQMKLIGYIHTDVSTLIEDSIHQNEVYLQEYLKTLLTIENSIEIIFKLYAGIRYQSSTFMLIEDFIKIVNLDKKVLQLQINNKNSPTFISEQGNFFQYSNNLILPFIQSINQFPSLKNLRRYQFSEICNNDLDSQILQHRCKVCMYDIVWTQKENDTNDIQIYHTVELIYLANDILSLFAKKSFIIQISHTSLLLLILDELGLNENFLIQLIKNQEFQSLLKQYSQKNDQYFRQCQDLLEQKFNLKRQKAERFLKLITIQSDNIQNFQLQLEQFMESSLLDQPMRELTKFLQLIDNKKVDVLQFQFRIFLFQDLKVYFNGICFEVIDNNEPQLLDKNNKKNSEKKKKIDTHQISKDLPNSHILIYNVQVPSYQVVMVGGCYSHYLNNNRQACGIQIYQDKLLFTNRFLRTKNQNIRKIITFDPLNQIIKYNHDAQWDNFNLDVLVSAEGDVLLLDEKLWLVSLLRQNKIQANFTIYEQNQSNIQGFNIKIQVYLKRERDRINKDQYIVKARFDNQKSEVDLNNLVEILKQRLLKIKLD